MVYIEKKIVKKGIFLLKFKDQHSLTSTFLRFQEHYESPKFRGKIFSLKEFKSWYKTTKKGKFTYYTDWNGFNIPNYILKPFYQGKFNPLSLKERKLLNLFKDQSTQFYIIGTHEKCNSFKHELGHAMFYMDSNYKFEVVKIIKRFKLNKIKKKLISIGYCNPVLNDEINAYSINGPQKITSLIPLELKNELKKLFIEFRKIK